MASVILSPVFNLPQFNDNDGNPLAGGKIFAYIAGSTTTLQPTYSDADGLVANSNPIVLDSSGRLNTTIWLLQGQFYRLVLTNSAGAVLNVFDNVSDQLKVDTVITEEYKTATAGQTTVTFVNSFTVGGNELEVYVNGAAQILGVDYTETTTNSITFSTGLHAGDVVFIRIFGAILYTPSAPPSTITTEAITATQDQTVVSISTPYTVGGHNLEVSLNGAVQVVGTDYNETSTTSITFLTPLNAGDVVYAKVYSVAVITKSDADLVTYNQGGLGAVETTVGAKLQETVSCTDFGTAADGVTDDTVAMKLFFDECISTGVNGYIPSGNYLISTGVLAFDNGFTDKTFPNITGGADITFTINQATKTDAPVLKLSNGTATSGVGKFWRNGSLPSIKFVDVAVGTANNRHCLQLTGTWGMKLGYMRGDNIRGSVIHIPVAQLVANPDPYSVALGTWEGVECNGGARYAVENLNGTGWNFCTIDKLRVINSTLGGLFGFGAANTVNEASMGANSGWCFDDGSFTLISTQPNNFRVNYAELDDNENGIRLNRAINCIMKARFAHRLHSSLGVYWPRTAFSIGGGTNNICTAGTFDFHHRFAGGGIKSQLGVVANYNSIGANMVGVTVDNNFSDDGGFGILDTDFYTGLTLNSKILIRVRGVRVWDSIQKNCVYGVADGSTTVNTATFGTAGSKVNLPGELYDDHSIFTGGEATLVDGGPYAASFKVLLDVPVGTKVRVGVMRVRAGVLQAQLHSQYWSDGAGPQSYSVAGLLIAVAGDIYYPIAQQTTAGAVTPTVLVAQSADNCFTLHQL